MSQLKPPRVLLFDIGGVCVLSPLQGILEYEKAHNITPGYINHSISATSPNGPWHQLERGEIPLDDTFFASFQTSLENHQRWHEYHSNLPAKAIDPAATPPPPGPLSIDSKKLFWSMMLPSQHPDPHIFPALQALKASGQYTLAGLSNTIIFPPVQHPLSHPTPELGPLTQIFDVFVSSAHLGMRKPEPRIYEYTMAKLRERVGADLQPEEVLFLDDIGANLKPARAMGMRTLRVHLGKTHLAVRKLEGILGMHLSSCDGGVGRAKM